MEFTKMHTSGRDYILIEETEKNNTKLSELAKRLCNRYFSVGASGLIALDKNENYKSEVYSPSGKLIYSDLSAAICTAAYLYNKTHISKQNIIQGSESFDILIQQQKNGFDVTADSGIATFLPDEIPLTSPAPVISRRVEVGNRILNLTALRLGNIFAVHETQSVADINFLSLGERITKHSLFNKKASAVFCERLSDSALFIRSYINGVGAVLSDAAASAAAVLALSQTYSLEYNREITVKSEGDKLYVLCKPDGSALVHTKAQIVFSGTR